MSITRSLERSGLRPFLVAVLLVLSSFGQQQADEKQAGVEDGSANQGLFPNEIDTTKYPNLQAALDAVPPTGGIVRLAPRRYEILQPLILKTPETRIEGAGPATHIVNRNQTGKPAIHIRPDDFEQNSKSRIWRIQIGNFRISGNPKSGDGVLAQGINEIFIHGLSVDHHGGHGINLEECYEDPRISDSILTYNSAAGLMIAAGHDIVVSANQFEENKDGLSCSNSFNLTCTGNNFDDHLRHGIVIENTYGSVVSGNMIEECQGRAIVLDRDCYGITLSANVIAHEFEGGIDLRDASGCSVSANTFTIVHQFGIRVGPASSRITITGNNFSNSYIGNGKHRRLLQHEQKNQIDVGTGVHLHQTKDIVISGNQFAGMDGKAITIDDESKRILVTGNIVRDFGRRTKDRVAIDKTSHPSNVVKDNIIH